MRATGFCLLLGALCASGYLLSASAVDATCVVRISGLQYSPTPPNPIKIAGTVVTEAPLVLTDGQGAVTVVGITGKIGDFIVVEGGFTAGVLSASQDPQNASGCRCANRFYGPPAGYHDLWCFIGFRFAR